MFYVESLEDSDENIDWQIEVTDVIKEYENLRKAEMKKKFKDQHSRDSRSSLVFQQANNKNLGGMFGNMPLQGMQPNTTKSKYIKKKTEMFADIFIKNQL